MAKYSTQQYPPHHQDGQSIIFLEMTDNQRGYGLTSLSCSRILLRLAYQVGHAPHIDLADGFTEAGEMGGADGEGLAVGGEGDGVDPAVDLPRDRLGFP